MQFTASSGVTVNLSDDYLDICSKAESKDQLIYLKSIPEKLFGNINITESGCWEWKGVKALGDYGTCIAHGLPERSTHRLSKFLTFGSIPDRMFVCHKCDNPPCMNPDHLWIGTHAENVRDEVLKNRQAQGETCGLSKLNNEDVINIIELIKSGKSYEECANGYPVKMENICCIARNKTWRSIVRPDYRRAKDGKRLTEQEVVKIIQMLHDGYSQSECAKAFNTDKANIFLIKKGVTWKNIPRPEFPKYRIKHGKLKESDVVEILNMIHNGATRKECANKYNVCVGVMFQIENGITWKSIPRPESFKARCKRKILNSDEVKKIIGMINDGITNAACSRIFNVWDSTVSNIRTGKTWKQFPRPWESSNNNKT